VRIGVIAPNRNPLCEPFAGGTEAHTVDLARGLRARGHTVSVFGPVGSPSDLVDRDDVLPVLSLSETALRDVSSAPAWFLAQHHAYLALMLRLQGEARDRFDVIHDNAIHYLTLSMASSTGVPTVATLHTPPTPWAESGFAASAGPRPVLRAVSQSSARLWAESLGPVPVIANGVDTAAFVPGPGGGGAVWIGRLVRKRVPTMPSLRHVTPGSHSPSRVRSENRNGFQPMYGPSSAGRSPTRATCPVRSWCTCWVRRRCW
jgi:hypothetical protein